MNKIGNRYNLVFSPLEFGTNLLGKWRKSEFWPTGGQNVNERLYCCKQSVLHAIQLLGRCNFV